MEKFFVKTDSSIINGSSWGDITDNAVWVPYPAFDGHKSNLFTFFKHVIHNSPSYIYNTAGHNIWQFGREYFVDAFCHFEKKTGNSWGPFLWKEVPTMHEFLKRMKEAYDLADHTTWAIHFKWVEE